jgi:hypothetical protein
LARCYQRHHSYRRAAVDAGKGAREQLGAGR